MKHSIVILSFSEYFHCNYILVYTEFKQIWEKVFLFSFFLEKPVLPCLQFSGTDMSFKSHS